MRLILTASFLALAACAPKPAEQAQAPAAEPAAALAQEPPPFNTRSITFEALSKTAEAFTGNVTFSAEPPADPNTPPHMKITGAKGVVYETALVPDGAEQATKVDWKSIFNAEVVTSANPPPFAPSVEVHNVISETVDPTAPNGGLCGKEKAGYIAIGTRLKVASQDVMSLAAFKGGVWPRRTKPTSAASTTTPRRPHPAARPPTSRVAN